MPEAEVSFKLKLAFAVWLSMASQLMKGFTAADGNQTIV
jgi:hypothetical protein